MSQLPVVEPPVSAEGMITTEMIQKTLEEGDLLIRAAFWDLQNGNVEGCMGRRRKLQQNLLFLASVADSQPQQDKTNAESSGVSSVPASGADPPQTSTPQRPSADTKGVESTPDT